MRALKIVMIIFLFSLPCRAQMQLVLLHKEKVLARYSEGQVFTYKLKKSKDFLIGFIVKVQEFSVITTFDTIQFSEIERVSLKGRNTSFLNLIGTAVLYAGIAYYAIDEVNEVLIRGNGYDSDQAVWKPALIMVGSGAIMKLIRKRSERIRYPGKLLAAPPGSAFYVPVE